MQFFVKQIRLFTILCCSNLVANISRGFANIINASNIQINICKIEINNYLVQKTWKLNHCGKPHLACKLATKVVVLLLSRLPTF